MERVYRWIFSEVWFWDKTFKDSEARRVLLQAFPLSIKQSIWKFSLHGKVKRGIKLFMWVLSPPVTKNFFSLDGHLPKSLSVCHVITHTKQFVYSLIFGPSFMLSISQNHPNYSCDCILSCHIKNKIIHSSHIKGVQTNLYHSMIFKV